MDIQVTRPFLPPQQEYARYVSDIWQRGWLTNNGPLLNELELQLKTYLNVPHMAYVSNGTIALQLAIKALGVSGEIITTPFSYVATTSAIVWENCTPVMVDIDPETLNLDPTKIEAAITPRTSCILATHVYGNACNVSAINQIADKHGLKVIYDAAHAFGTTLNGNSLFNYGDIATTSFHATKLFHTVEGGGLICQDAGVMKVISELRNFGHQGPSTFELPGINGKNSEFHAAMGLCNLKYIGEILKTRRSLSEHYDSRLAGLPLVRPRIMEAEGYNYAYYPIILSSEAALLRTTEALQKNNIFPRRYFYPSLSELPYLKDPAPTPISNDFSRRVMCLPLYHSLSVEEVDLICRIISRTLNYDI